MACLLDAVARHFGGYCSKGGFNSGDGVLKKWISKKIFLFLRALWKEIGVLSKRRHEDIKMSLVM
jgi:hypothetical protein